jgi:LysW-gamma-L-lysine carboxypeptidase
MGSRHDGMSDSARLTAGFRLPVGFDPLDLERALRALAPEGMTLVCEGHEAAHRTGRNDPVVRAISTAIRARGSIPRPKLKTGTADLNVVAPIWRCPIAAYGPGDSALDHTPHERLALDEYLAAIGVLTEALPALAADLIAERTKRADHAPLSLTA